MPPYSILTSRTSSRSGGSCPTCALAGCAYRASASTGSSPSVATERRHGPTRRTEAASIRGWCHARGFPRQSPWMDDRAVLGPPFRGPETGLRAEGSSRAGREQPLILLDCSRDEAAGGFLECGVLPRFPCRQGAPPLVGRQELIPRHEGAVVAEHRALPKRGRSVLAYLRDDLGHDVGRDVGFL